MEITISCSSGIRLCFLRPEEHEKYKRELLNTQMRAYHTEVISYGIYASNQDKYVETIADFNEWDDRHTHDTYLKWLNT